MSSNPRLSVDADKAIIRDVLNDTETCMYVGVLLSIVRDTLWDSTEENKGQILKAIFPNTTERKTTERITKKEELLRRVRETNYRDFLNFNHQMQVNLMGSFILKVLLFFDDISADEQEKRSVKIRSTLNKMLQGTNPFSSWSPSARD